MVAESRALDPGSGPAAAWRRSRSRLPRAREKATTGLVLGFVREKSGGILASALLHGLPQALASVAMLFL